MPKTLKLRIILVIAALLLYQALLYFQPGFLRLLNRWEATQIVILPLVYFALLGFTVRGRRIPRVLFVASFVCVALMAALSYTPSGPVIVAKLMGDDLETQSRIVRDTINQFSRPDGLVPARRFYRSLENQGQVDQLMSSSPDLQAVVWGNAGWLTVSFSPQRSLIPESSGAISEIERRFGVKLIDRVRSFGLSYQGDSASLQYLAGVFASVVGPTHLGTSEEAIASTQLDYERVEKVLQATTQVRGHWTGTAHQAMADWILGTMYLVRAEHEDKFERATYQCAIDALVHADTFLRALTDNPELRGAIYNNLAVAHFLIYRYTGEKQSLRNALDSLRWLMRFRRLIAPNLRGQTSLQVAAENMALIRIEKKRLKMHRKLSSRGLKKNRHKRPH